jgi:hypothetical protein
MSKEIVSLGDGRWGSKEELIRMSKLYDRYSKYMMFGIPQDEKEKIDYRKSLKDNKKMAYVKQGNTTFMAWVDNVTGRAYRNDSFKYYEATWEEIKVFTFVRWLRGMDV